MKITGEYDAFCDVLYVSFTDPPCRARSRTAEITALIRTDEAGKLVGLTVEAAQYQAERARDVAP